MKKNLAYFLICFKVEEVFEITLFYGTFYQQHLKNLSLKQQLQYLASWQAPG